MIKAALFIACIISITAVSAQPAYVQGKNHPSRMIGLLSPSDIPIGFWDNAELQPVDTTLLEAVYDLKYRRETVSGIYSEMLSVLQIGSIRQKYYSMIRQFIDDIQIDVYHRMKSVAALPGVGVQHQFTAEERRIKATAGVDWLNSEIWMDFLACKLTERMHDYKKFNRSLEYEEPIPAFEWQFTEQVDTICGYHCFAATTIFRGREWTAWYTPEIPFRSGPWKFNGLPGLILRVQDSIRDYQWECRCVMQESKPIVYYKVDELLLTRRKWRRYLRQLHDDPLSMLEENGKCAIYIKGEQVTGEDNWQIPYNPIELE